MAEFAVIARDFPAMLADFEHSILAIGMDHAGSLDIPHKDPFDRMLIAQAQIERVSIVSNEELFDGFAVERIW